MAGSTSRRGLSLPAAKAGGISAPDPNSVMAATAGASRILVSAETDFGELLA
ncbi:MAG: hypothetical protein M0T77_07990 [Actinomycetota bacterium]|nr:hypothetical protein [Actinomycetota bacterium]